MPLMAALEGGLVKGPTKSCRSGETLTEHPESQMMVKVSSWFMEALHAQGCCKTTDSLKSPMASDGGRALNLVLRLNLESCWSLKIQESGIGVLSWRFALAHELLLHLCTNLGGD